MPYAQQDVHLRDLDFVKTLVQRVQDVRAAEAAKAAPPAKSTPEPSPPREPETTAVEPEPEQKADFRMKRRS